MGALYLDQGIDAVQRLIAPLVVPEINPEHALQHSGIVANPNCSTIITLMALNPLHQAFGVRRVVASTYQAVSGTGAQAIAHVLGEIVTSRIGGSVEYVPGNNATIFQAMDQGKGDIDVHPDAGSKSSTGSIIAALPGSGSAPACARCRGRSCRRHGSPCGRG